MDLACGTGLGLLEIAAAYPQVEFHGYGVNRLARHDLGLARDQLKEAQTQFKCSICMEATVDVFTLCGHTFCNSCLSNVFAEAAAPHTLARYSPPHRPKHTPIGATDKPLGQEIPSAEPQPLLEEHSFFNFTSSEDRDVDSDQISGKWERLLNTVGSFSTCMSFAVMIQEKMLM